MLSGAERVAVSAGVTLPKESARVYPHQKGSEDYDAQPAQGAERSQENRGAQEQLLLRRIAEGDSSAFWKIWEEYCPHLYRVCLRHMGGVREDAEDALSMAMLNAWERMPRHAQGIANVKAWLSRLTHNLCMDIHRERRQTKCFSSLDEITDTERDVVARSVESPEQATMHKELALVLNLMVARLPSKLRTVFELRFLQEMRYSDIATHLTITNDNARKRCQQARTILRAGVTRYMSGLTRLSLKHADSREGASSEEQPERECPPYATSQRVTAVRYVNVSFSDIENSFQITLVHMPTIRDAKIDTLEKYVRQHPKGWKKRVELAERFYATGRWEEAIGQYRWVLTKQPRLIAVVMRLGELLCAMERGAEAIEVYEQFLVRAHAAAARIHFDGLKEMCRGHYGTAAGLFRQALQLEPRQKAYWHSLGDVYLKTGAAMKALQAYDAALEVEPDDIVALTSSSEALTAIGEEKEAARRLHRALALDPEHGPALKRLIEQRSVMGLVKGEEGNQTRLHLRRAQRTAPDVAEVCEARALYLLFRGEWKEGVALLREFTERRPNNPRGWHNYARSLFRTGDAEAAVEAIKRAHALSQSDMTIHLSACTILRGADRPQELQTLLAAMLDRFPQHWSVWAKAGLAIAQRLGEAERACAVSVRGPQLQPDLAAAWIGHGRVLSSVGRHLEAVAAFEEALNWLPSDDGYSMIIPATCWLGESRRAVGNEQRARACWLNAAVALPEFIKRAPAYGHYWHGRILELLSDSTKALDAYLKALNNHLLYPARQEAQEAVKRLRPRR